MNRTTDPIQVRLHRAYVPYSHVRRPQRVADRQQMHGPLVPLHQERMCGLQWVGNGIVVALFAVVAVLCASRGWAW